jgi:hypothetical protein
MLDRLQAEVCVPKLTSVHVACGPNGSGEAQITKLRTRRKREEAYTRPRAVQCCTCTTGIGIGGVSVTLREMSLVLHLLSLLTRRNALAMQALNSYFEHTTSLTRYALAADLSITCGCGGHLTPQVLPKTCLTLHIIYQNLC